MQMMQRGLCAEGVRFAFIIAFRSMLYSPRVVGADKSWKLERLGDRSHSSESYYHRLGHPAQIALKYVAQCDFCTSLILRECSCEILSRLNALAIDVSDYVMRVQTHDFSRTLETNVGYLDSFETVFDPICSRYA
jgi:hypothetical protein